MIAASIPMALSLSFIGWRLSSEDIKTHSVPILDLILYSLITAIFGSISWISCFWGFLLMGLLSVANFLFKKKIIAEADQFLIFTLPFFIDVSLLPQFLIVCGILILLLKFFMDSDKMPFMPAFFMGMLICYLL